MLITDLPLDLLWMIGDRLDYAGLLAVRWTCKSMYSRLERHPFAKQDYEMLDLLGVVRWYTFDHINSITPPRIPDRFACCSCLRIKDASHFESLMVPTPNSTFAYKYWYRDQWKDEYDDSRTAPGNSTVGTGAINSGWVWDDREALLVDDESDSEAEFESSDESDSDYAPDVESDEGSEFGYTYYNETRKVFRYDHSLCLECGCTAGRYVAKKIPKRRKKGADAPQAWERRKSTFYCDRCHQYERAGFAEENMVLCRECVFRQGEQR